jgi:hypothetical protein
LYRIHDLRFLQHQAISGAASAVLSITCFVYLTFAYAAACPANLSCCSTKGLSAEELLVYQVIKQAGNTGEHVTCSVLLMGNSTATSFAGRQAH